MVAAFTGGVLGAVIGAFHTFIPVGIVVIAGQTANLAGRNVGMPVGGDPATLGAVGITMNVGFGAVPAKSRSPARSRRARTPPEGVHGLY